MRGILTLCMFVGALLLGAEANGQSITSVTLGWNPSPSSGVAGYYIYYGPSSGNYTNVVPVANVTNVTIRGLVPGGTYFIAATGYDSNFNQGAFSQEISITAGAVGQATAGMLTAIASLPGGQFGFALAGSTGGQYIVQASTDLVHWVALQTNVAPFKFIDSNTTQFSRRFYRTVYNSN